MRNIILAAVCALGVVGSAAPAMANSFELVDEIGNKCQGNVKPIIHERFDLKTRELGTGNYRLNANGVKESLDSGLLEVRSQKEVGIISGIIQQLVMSGRLTCTMNTIHEIIVPLVSGKFGRIRLDANEDFAELEVSD